MTRRRLPAPGFSASTKGHSVLRRYVSSGSPPSARRYGYSIDYSNVSPVRSRYYSGEEDYLNSQVQRATSIGAEALYDTLDTANLSRNRDYDLLTQTNQAIVNSETHSSPRAAVASLRARSRPQAQPASARDVQPRRYYQEVAFVRASSAPPVGRPVVVYARPRQSSVPRSSSPYVARARSPSIERSESVDRDYFSPAFDYLMWQPQAKRVVREARDRTRRPYNTDDQYYLTARYDRSIRNAQRALSPYRYDFDYVSPTRVGLYHYISPATSRREAQEARLLNYYYASPLTRRPYRRYWRSLAAQYNARQDQLPYYELISAPQNLYQNDVYRVLVQRPRSNKKKQRSLYAAIVASKLEDEPGTRRRKGPKSKFAADKYRATHKVGENPLYFSQNSAVTTGLTSSAPPIQKLTERKAIRDVDGNFTKPRNILSWQRY